jgi:opacity protein-like surface antigen
MSNSGRFFRVLSLIGLATGLVLFAPDVSAQISANEDGEVVAYGGGTFGGGAHPLVGGGSGWGFSRHGMFFLDASYSPMGREILWPRHDVHSPQDSHLFDVMFSTHIRFPIRDRWAPYGLVGGGLAFNSFRAYAGPQGALIGIEDFKMAFQTGGGVRYYVNENWGIRPEFKVIVSTRTYTRMAIGVFYTLPPNWP